MANLKQLKLKRQSVIKTSKVTKAMEAVSAVKMRKSQERALAGRPFAETALDILLALSSRADKLDLKYMKSNKCDKLGLILISSDKGLAGALNSSVLKKASEFIEKNGTQNIKAIAIGKKANDFFTLQGVEVILFKENKKDDIDLQDSQEILDIIKKEFREEKVGSWTAIYMNFVSTFEQNAISRQILPLNTKEYQALISDIIPNKGKYSELKDEENSGPQAKYIIEAQDKEEILESLADALINVFLHHAMLEHKASEHSARMVAMKSATDKAKELAHELKLKFNKARQAAITREVSEITSGVEAMKD